MSRLDCDTTLLETARAVGTPAYVYDLEILTKRIAQYRRAFDLPGFTLLFATMANPATEILRLLASWNVGACVNSIPHLHLAIANGIRPDRIQFTASGLAREQMQELIRLEIRTNLDSPSQIDQWRDCGGGPFGLRVNAGSLVGRDGDRLGIAAEDLPGIVARMGPVRALHVYVGTNFRRPEDMFPTLRAFYALAKEVGSLEYLNVGGGIGVDYERSGSPFDISAYARELCQLHRDFAGPRDIALYFEPGRSLTADSGVFLSSVTDVKALGGKVFVACDASIAIFPRPFHQPESPHQVRPLGRTASEQRDVVVVGRTTFSRDILAQCRLPDALQVGDVLAFEDSGAYCHSMASRFLGQPEPASVFLGDD